MVSGCSGGVEEAGEESGQRNGQSTVGFILFKGLRGISTPRAFLQALPNPAARFDLGSQQSKIWTNVLLLTSTGKHPQNFEATHTL